MRQFLVFIAVYLALFSAVLTKEVCQTDSCIALSGDLLQHSINESVSPCDDFFDYVCGKWPESHPLPTGAHGLNYFGLRRDLVAREIDEAFLNALNSSNVAVQSVAQFYSDCLDSATIEKRGMTPLLEKIHLILGEWPLLQKPGTKRVISHWQDLYVNIFAYTGLSPVFDLRSMYNSTLKKSIININLGLLSNGPHRGYPLTESGLTAYRTFLHKLVPTFFAVPDNEHLKVDIEAVLHLEAKLSAAYRNAFASGHHNVVHNFHGHFADLAIALKSKADIRSMVNQILVKLSLSKVPPLTPTDMVHAQTLPYLVEAVTILETTPISVIQNWLGLILTFQLGGSWSTAALQREIVTFNGGHYDPAVTKAICNSLPMHWPAVQARIYIDTHFSQNEKSEAETLVKSLRIAFEGDLQNHTEWLDEKTKKAALEKLKAIKQLVGYDASTVSDETLKLEYPELNNKTILRGKFFESAMTLRIDVRRANLARLHPEPASVHPSLGGVVDDPTTVNAFYSRIGNSITIPAGILQPPFFDDQRPYAMNYGAIGTVIGHELTHGFDNNGAQYDKYGLRVNWWTNETLAKFNEKSKCFVEQYGALREPLSGLMLNGSLTLGENIADNGGIKKAYTAYLEHQKATDKPSSVLPGLKLTADQLFFTAYAHVWCENETADEVKKVIRFNAHSPGRFRVNTVLGNTAAFAEAFKCPLGSKMNPVKKCSLW